MTSEEQQRTEHGVQDGEERPDEHVFGPSPLYVGLIILFVFVISLLVPAWENALLRKMVDSGRSELATVAGYSVLVVAAMVATLLWSLVHSALSHSVFERIERTYPGLKRADYIVNQLVQNVLFPLLVALLLFYLL